MQTGNGKKMEGTGLLERFFDIIACLMTKPKGGSGDTIARIERLQKLREEGALTKAEFDREKAKILAEQ